jgi:hypothetical protein
MKGYSLTTLQKTGVLIRKWSPPNKERFKRLTNILTIKHFIKDKYITCRTTVYPVR